MNKCDTTEKKFSMKNYIIFFSIGILFGIAMTKSEAISWFRIYEMFRFQSFHMYGIIGVAVILGMIQVFIIKKYNTKNVHKKEIKFHAKQASNYRYILGGIIFGLGWALSGACPGPMFTLLGNGIVVMIVVILSALLGTFVYGLVKDKLPH